MNPAESLGDIVADIEEAPETKEKTVCARLILTNEQIIDYYSKIMQAKDLLESDEILKISEDFHKTFNINPVEARLVFTDEQASDLRAAFNMLDYTGDGKINAEDFRVAIKALGYEPTKEELQKMVNAVDKGDTGKLSFENFETAIMRKVMSQDSDGDIMKSFRLFDMDDTGFISFDNVKRVSQILGCGLTDEEVDEMIDDADKDFDGFISVQEFMKMIKNSVKIVTP